MYGVRGVGGVQMGRQRTVWSVENGMEEVRMPEQRNTESVWSIIIVDVNVRIESCTGIQKGGSAGERGKGGLN